MKTVMLFFLGLFVIEGLAMMGVALPLILRRIKPNGLYGFRVPATLNDPAAWYRVNARFGKGLFLTGAVFALAAIGFHFVPGVGNEIAAYPMVCTVVLFIALGVAIWDGQKAIGEQNGK